MKEARRASSFLGCLRPEGRGGEAALGGLLPPAPRTLLWHLQGF